jgi:hypothetical protein
MKVIKFNANNILLLLGLIALPVAGLMLHLKLHSDLVFLTYVLLFNIIIIPLLFLFNKTRFYGFILNSVSFVAGVIMHAIYVPGGGISDILLAVPDFAIGYVLWRLNLK